MRRNPELPTIDGDADPDAIDGESLPTKRDSGAYAIMSDACRVAEQELDALLAAPASKRVEDEPNAAELRRLASEARALSATVAKARAEKEQLDAKGETVNRIISLVERVRALGVSGRPR